MKEAASRRANRALAVQIVVQAIIFFAVYSAWDGVVDRFTVTSGIVLAVVVLFVVALVALSVRRQTRRFGGRQQVRALKRAISSTGVLPHDADRELWRDSLLAGEAQMRPWRVRVMWLAFMISIGAAQAFARGETGLIDLAVLLVIGLVVGGITGQVMISLSQDTLTNTRQLLDQIDDELAREPA